MYVYSVQCRPEPEPVAEITERLREPTQTLVDAARRICKVESFNVQLDKALRSASEPLSGRTTLWG